MRDCQPAAAFKLLAYNIPVCYGCESTKKIKSFIPIEIKEFLKLFYLIQVKYEFLMLYLYWDVLKTAKKIVAIQAVQIFTRVNLQHNMTNVNANKMLSLEISSRNNINFIDGLNWECQGSSYFVITTNQNHLQNMYEIFIVKIQNL